MAHGEIEELKPIPADNPGYDPTDPPALSLGGFIIAFVVVMVVIFGATAAYFEWAYERRVDSAVLEKPSEELKALHEREDVQLNSYGFVDSKKSAVQLPVERAMELVAAEAAAGKVKWTTTPTPKKDEPAAGAAAPGAAAATPAAAAGTPQAAK